MFQRCSLRSSHSFQCLESPALLRQFHGGNQSGGAYRITNNNSKRARIHSPTRPLNLSHPQFQQPIPYRRHISTFELPSPSAASSASSYRVSAHAELLDEATSIDDGARTESSFDPSELFEPEDPEAAANFTTHYKKIRKATNYASRDMFEAAWRSILEYVDYGGSTASHDFERACNLFLYRATRQDQSYSSISQILANFIDIDFSPSVDTYNILLRNAIDREDAATAWQIYDMLRSSEIEANDAIFCNMLYLCRQTNDLKAYKQLYYAHLDPASRTELDPRLLTEILVGNIWLHKNAFYNLEHALKIYERFADLQPLRILGIIPEDHVSRFDAYRRSPPPRPSAGTLNVMVYLYLQPNNLDIYTINDVYQKFIEQIDARDPAFLPLLKGPWVWTSFLKAMTRWPRTFGIGNTYRDRLEIDIDLPHLHWRNILQRMVQPPPEDVVNPETGRPLPQQRPDAHHWTIIANSYVKAGCYDEAKALVQLMYDQGIKPTLVTWKVLFGTAGDRPKLDQVTAKRQPDTLAELLEYMTPRDIRVNERTVRLLSYLDEETDLEQFLRNSDEARPDSGWTSKPSPDYQPEEETSAPDF